MFDGGIGGIQNDKKDVGHERFDFGLESLSKVTNDGDEQSQRQGDDASVARGAILEQTHAQIIANGKAKAGSRVQFRRGRGVIEHVQQELQGQNLGLHGRVGYDASDVVALGRFLDDLHRAALR